VSSKFVISLDFELMWGVRDHRSSADYGDAVLGGRKAIPEMLRRFETHGIRATWATVGLLFARNREEMLACIPDILPKYDDPKLSPYRVIVEEIGENERDDPMYFGRSLVERVRDTEGQEIGTHTFSHYYCLEPGQSEAAFEADLMASLRIARESDINLSSIVFPRNQMAPEHIAICVRQGVRCFRGNQGGFAYRSRPRGGNTRLVRGVRLLDAVVPVTGRHSYPETTRVGEAINVPASRFFRPYSQQLGGFHELHVSQILREMRSAAKRGEIYHLWWHPHNMGRHTERNLAQLDRILAEFIDLQNQHGMTSANMSDFLPAESAGGLSVTQ